MRTGIKRTLAILAVALAVLSAYVTIRFLNARHRAQTNACAGNMRLLASAKEQWGLEAHVTNGQVDVDGLLQLLPRSQMPRCAGGGEYTLGNPEEIPRCSLHGTITNRHYPKWWQYKEGIEPGVPAYRREARLRLNADVGTRGRMK